MVAENEPVVPLNLGRFRSVPTYALLAQLFLGLGWIRAAAAHALASSWWSGAEVTEFLADRHELRNPFYGFFLDNVVAALPGVIAAIVLAAEVTVGVLLITNVRTKLALVVGIFLNAHFILAGQVNPSIFYVILSITVLLFPLHKEWSYARARKAALVSTLCLGGAAVLLAPSVTTLHPESVIEDPSLVLIMLLGLVAVVMWHLANTAKTSTASAGVSRGGTSQGFAMAAVLADGQPGSKTWSSDADALGERRPLGLTKRSSMITDVNNGVPSVAWFSVRCHFQLDDSHYEERITVWRAEDFEAAIELAEAEAQTYAAEVGGRYLDSCDSFNLAETGASLTMRQGSAIYSLVRVSDLAPAEYLASFFFTGQEQSAAV